MTSTNKLTDALEAEVTALCAFHSRTDRQLNDFDFRCLRLIKQGAYLPDAVSKEGFCALWDERCGVTGTTSLENWTRHWLSLNDTFCWFTANGLIEGMAPSILGGHRFRIIGDASNYWDLVFSAVASKLMLTKVVDLPGYQEWLYQQIPLTLPSEEKTHDSAS